MTLDLEMQWLQDAESLPLYAAWGPPQRNWLAKLFGRRSKRTPIGTLRVEQNDLVLTLGMAKPVRVSFDQPFRIFLSCQRFVDHGVAEIDLSVRSLDVSATQSWLQFRTVWPIDHMDASIPDKQSYAPFLSPQHFGRVYRALSGFAQVHGDAVPGGLRFDVADAAWDSLVSRSILDHCVACGSSAVIPIAEETYRCIECGHEGGDGLAAYFQAQR